MVRNFYDWRNRTYYKLWMLGQGKKLGATSYIPMPAFIRKYISKYPIRMQVVLYARTLIGQKVYKGVPKEVACANVVSGILELVDPSFFGNPNEINRVDGTYTLSDLLINNPRFRRMNIPIPASILLYATGKGLKGKIGHVHIVDLDGTTLMSNNSLTGKFDRHSTVSSAQKVYRDGYKMPEEVYSIIK